MGKRIKWKGGKHTSGGEKMREKGNLPAEEKRRSSKARLFLLKARHVDSRAAA